MDDVSGWSVPAEPATGAAGISGALKPGRVLGNRYEILQILGEGGMGAVYKARDRELDRLVALKVIRPEFAQNPDVLRRFKQELILARQVTHRNVIRIFDLGEADGIKFITMEFIEGRDLKMLLRESGKFEPRKAAEIIAQVCRALEAAHTEGVIHRDLKPQNIMVDANGKVSVMDFGIARSMEVTAGGMTQTGALVGTPEYMSPEQAKGEKLDARTDIFALGIIFYELLTGDSPYKADTAMASLYKRTLESPRPPIELNPDIPQALSNIVVHCLQIDKEKRYASASEILQDLAIAQGTRAGTVALPAAPSAERAGFALGKKWTLGGVVVVLAALAVIIYVGKFRRPAKPAAEAPAVSLAILPFANASGDPKLDWLGSSLADMLSTDVGQSPHVRVVSPNRLDQILRDLQLSADSFSDAANVRRLADMSSADRVVWGKYAKAGDKIRLDATLHDIKRDRSVSFEAEAADQNGLSPAVDHLAGVIRQSLSLPPDVIKELEAQSLKPSSKSLLALRYYNEGLQLARQGKNLEAVKRLEASTKEDPEFALAYSELALSDENLGRATDADQLSRKAVELSEALPAQEKYLIAANRARITKDYAKAISSYENLAKVSPDNTDILFGLAKLYEDSGALDKARAYYSKALEADPKSANVLLALGRVAIESGDASGGLDSLNRALSLSIETGNDEEKAMVLQAIGIDYSILNKPDDALQNYRQSLEIKRRLGEKTGIANSLEQIAQIQASQGKSDEALKNFNEAMALRREVGDKAGLGNVLNDLGDFYNGRGQYDQALQLFKESLQIQRDVGNENNQGLALNNVGNTYLFKGDYDNARIYFEQALTIREKLNVPTDIADTLHNLAETSTKTGQYDQAMAQYVRALDLRRGAGDKRGAAIEAYSLGTVFGFQGRYGAAVNSKREALNTFRDLQEQGFWLAEILSGYGEALAQIGKSEEARKSLTEALSLARDLKNDALIAQTLGYEGDDASYRGDLKGAKALYDEATREASRSADRHLILALKVDLARLAIQQGQTDVGRLLKGIAEEADTLGLQYLSVESSTLMAQAFLNKKDYTHATEQLENALARSEKLGLRTQQAKTHYLFARILQLTGNPSEAARHYSQARQILDEIRKEAGTDEVLKRSDLAPIYAASAVPPT